MAIRLSSDLKTLEKRCSSCLGWFSLLGGFSEVLADGKRALSHECGRCREPAEFPSRMDHDEFEWYLWEMTCYPFYGWMDQLADHEMRGISRTDFREAGVEWKS